MIVLKKPVLINTSGVMVSIHGHQLCDFGSNPGWCTGGLAQLVERALSLREVAGSIPVFSTLPA